LVAANRRNQRDDLDPAQPDRPTPTTGNNQWFRAATVEADAPTVVDQGEHGYQVKRALEAEFGDLLPAMNTGQDCSTLARLERDGLVEGKRVYRLTEAARAALAHGSRHRCPAAASRTNSS
jgi:hypothetical protein